MSQRYQPHKDVRCSGVTWLGEVPEHWSLIALKFLVSMKSGDGITSERIDKEGDYPVFGGNGLRGYTSDFTHDGHYVVIGRQGALCGNVNYATGKFWASEHAVVATPTKDLDTTWLGEMIRAMNLNQYSETAAQPGLSMEYIGNLRTVLPPLDEQKQIAAFLDYETAKIDGLIEKQQQLIALLGEKRQAVISHAVTKGLNPDAPMRDSAIEWLGEVPEHWTVRELKQSIESGTSISYGIVQPGEPLEDGVPFVQTTNISKGNFRLEDLQRTTPAIAAAYPRSRLAGGEVILGIRASIGAAFVVPDSLRGFNLSRGIARIVPAADLSAAFLVWYLRSQTVELYWGLSSQGSTFSEVSIDTVKKLYLAIPPISEQLEISGFVTKQTDRIDDLIGKAIRQNDLLQERRTALISAAVTGKIDVRGWKPPSSAAKQETELEVA